MSLYWTSLDFFFFTVLRLAQYENELIEYILLYIICIIWKSIFTLSDLLYISKILKITHIHDAFRNTTEHNIWRHCPIMLEGQRFTVFGDHNTIHYCPYSRWRTEWTDDDWFSKKLNVNKSRFSLAMDLIYTTVWETAKKSQRWVGIHIRNIF